MKKVKEKNWYIFKQLQRSLMSNILFCLLLTLAGLLLYLAVGLWYSAHSALRDIDNSLTTIAIPDSFFIRRYANDNELDETEVLRNLRNRVYPSGPVDLDSRRIYNALSEDIRAVPLQTDGLGLEPALAAFSPQSLSAFVLTCTSIDTNYEFDAFYDEENDRWHYFVIRSYSAVFTVNQVLSLHESFENEPRNVTINFQRYADESLPFEIGKRYIALGNYSMGAGLERGFHSLTVNVPFAPNIRTVLGNINNEFELVGITGQFHTWVTEDMYPMQLIEFRRGAAFSAADNYDFFEVTGSVEDALQTEDWVRMQQDLANAEISANSFQILTTNDANSLVRLNQNRNLMHSGRMISEREYRTGRRVALVSEEFAEHNGLTVGDAISLQIFETEMQEERFSFFAQGDRGEVRTINVWVGNQFSPDLAVTGTMRYTIVGIINIPANDMSEHAVSKNMIIIPDNSFPGINGIRSEAAHNSRHPLLIDAIIVPNGHVRETRALINSIGENYAGLFRFFDQGYGTLSVALSNMRTALSWIMGLVTAVWLTVVYLFSMYFTARKRKEASLLASIGVSKQEKFEWIFFQAALIIIVSLIISVIAAIPMFGSILETAATISEDFIDAFRDLTRSDAADLGLRSQMPLSSSPISLIIISAISGVLFLGVTAIMSLRAVSFSSLSALNKGENR